MGEINFKRLGVDSNELIELYTSSSWPYHADPNPKVSEIQQRFDTGWYEDDRETYWIMDGAKRLGIVILSDVSDTIPMLYDIRLVRDSRGRGIGVKTMKWVADTLFQRSELIIRIEAYTRADNLTMRQVFSKSGFVKEGYLRDSWENDDGSIMDSLCYAIIRRDWQTGLTTEIDINDVPY